MIINKQTTKTITDVRSLEEKKKTSFFRALDAISFKSSEFCHLNLKYPDFKLTIKYPRNNFINDIQQIIENIDKNDSEKIWDLVGFQLKRRDSGEIVLYGYPVCIDSYESVFEKNSTHLMPIIEKIESIVKKFTVENRVLSDGKFVSDSMADVFTDMFNALPEFYSVVGKKQHKTHSYTVDIHTFNVIRECIQDSFFEKLNVQQKYELLISALLHDISKEEYSIDKAHPTNSANDAYCILKKFNLPETMHSRIYLLIKNHDMLEQCNKQVLDALTGEKRPVSDIEQNKIVMQYADELGFDNNVIKLACILTGADLKSVKRDGSFFLKYRDALCIVSKKLDTIVQRYTK